MATSVVIVPAGSTSATIAVTPLTSVLAGPAVLGGTTTLSFASNPAGPFLPWSFGASANPQSFRSSVNGYVQVTAATQISNVAVADMSSVVGDRSPASLISANCAFASASSTSEQVIGSIRIPPGLLPMNGRLRFAGSVSMLNGAGTKALNLRVAGITGTNAAVIPTATLASTANCNFLFEIGLRGDGVTQALFGSGLTGIGLGTSATAYGSYSTLNYQQNEIEYVITCTKGTAGDLMQLESFLVQLV